MESKVIVTVGLKCKWWEVACLNGLAASLRSETTTQTDFGGHTEVNVQTEFNETKDVGAGGDTPLATSIVTKVIASDWTSNNYLHSQNKFKRAFFFNEEEEFNHHDEFLTMEDLRKPVDHGIVAVVASWLPCICLCHFITKSIVHTHIRLIVAFCLTMVVL